MSAGVFDEAGVIWQIAELGKVDAGGGGTVAMYMANRNIDHPGRRRAGAQHARPL